MCHGVAEHGCMMNVAKVSNVFSLFFFVFCGGEGGPPLPCNNKEQPPKSPAARCIYANPNPTIASP